MSEPQLSPEAMERILERALAALGEHFDAVQIFATGMDEDRNTFDCASGMGNWHARRGMVDQWVRRNNIRDECSLDLDDLDMP